MAKAKALDFTNVKDGGQFNAKHQPPGDYKAKISKVADAKSKGDGEAMWLFTITVGTGTYPYYCKLQENQLWKIRNIFVAAGLNIPKKRVNVDPNKIVGKTIGVTLEDDEYEGKMKSVISATFPPSELEENAPGDDGDDDSGEDDEESVEAPQGKKKKDKKGKKAKKASDVTDDELEELDIEDI